MRVVIASSLWVIFGRAFYITRPHDEGETALCVIGFIALTLLTILLCGDRRRTASTDRRTKRFVRHARPTTSTYQETSSQRMPHRSHFRDCLNIPADFSPRQLIAEASDALFLCQDMRRYLPQETEGAATELERISKHGRSELEKATAKYLRATRSWDSHLLWDEEVQAVAWLILFLGLATSTGSGLPEPFSQCPWYPNTYEAARREAELLAQSAERSDVN